MGVVRQAVKTSAGRSGDWGSTSPALQAASKMTSFMRSSPALPGLPMYPVPRASASCMVVDTELKLQCNMTRAS